MTNTLPPNYHLITYPRSNRYGGWTQKFIITGSQEQLKGYLRVSENADGTLHGFQIDIYKEGSFGKAIVNALAACVNIGIQNGVPLSTYIEQLKGWKFEPTGMVQGSAQVEYAESLLDYVACELEVAYLNKEK